MKTHNLVGRTSNSSVYNKAKKLDLENSGEISCSHCAYRKKDNYRRSSRHKRNWKNYRRNQYRACNIAVNVLGFQPRNEGSSPSRHSIDLEALKEVLSYNTHLGMLKADDLISIIRQYEVYVKDD